MPASGTRPRLRFGAIVDSLTVAVLVFRHHHLVYSNAAAQQLAERLRAKYRSELSVLLRDYIVGLGEKLDRGTTISLLTSGHGEPFYVRVMPLDLANGEVAVSVRELGTSMGAFRNRYRLSARSRGPRARPSGLSEPRFWLWRLDGRLRAILASFELGV